MNRITEQISKDLPKVLHNPGKAIELAWRRVFPFGIKPKDKEAYRIGSWSYGDAKRLPIAEIFPGIEQSDLRLINAYERDPLTSMDPQEVLALCAIAKHIDCKKIIEIGTFDGNTTLNLAANTEESTTITTVDLPPNWDGELGIEVPGFYQNVTDRKGVGRQFSSSTEHDYSNRITQVYADSAKLDWGTLDGPFDLAFIDGCHYYDYVRKDTENALKHVRPGGVIAWHDYGMIEDVSRAVDELGSKLSPTVVRGTRLAVAVLS